MATVSSNPNGPRRLRSPGEGPASRRGELKKLVEAFSVPTSFTPTFTPETTVRPKLSVAEAATAVRRTSRAVTRLASRQGVSTGEAAKRLRQTKKEIVVARGALRGLLEARGGAVGAGTARQRIVKLGGVSPAIAKFVVRQATQVPGSGVTRKTPAGVFGGPARAALRVAGTIRAAHRKRR
jgi:hypothetical protein